MVEKYFDASFFEHEAAPILARFLVRDGYPDPNELAARWADTLNIKQPERRIFYTRELELVAADFLSSLANHLRMQVVLRELNDSRAFEQLVRDVRALRQKLGAEQATPGTRRDYLRWLISCNLYIDTRGIFQTQRQMQVKLDEVYVSLRAHLADATATDEFKRELQKMAELLRNFSISQYPDTTGGPRDRSRVELPGNRESSPALNLTHLYMSLPLYDLEDKITELQARAGMPARQSADTIAQLGFLYEDLLSSNGLEEILDLSEAVNRHRRLILLGDPGSGKTTLLRYLALKHAQALYDGRNEASSDLGEAYFPILIRIAEYAENGAWKEKSLSDFLAKSCMLHECPADGLADLLRLELEKGNCLILLDGLDEVVNTDERRRIVQRIEDFVRRYAEKANRFVITSRIAGYTSTPLGEPFVRNTILDMDEPQIQSFLEHWCQAVEDAETPDLPPQQRKQIALREINEIMKAVKHSPGVRRLAANPLLLRTLALIHRTGAQLPQKRIELYRLAADTLARTWRSAQGVPESALVKDEYLTRMLGKLAYWFHLNKATGIATEREVYDVLGEEWARINELKWDADDPNPRIIEEIKTFLLAVREHTGLFVERTPRQYGFMHLTFEEYYTARYLVERSRTRAHLIRKHLHDPRWEEPILLALGFVGLDSAGEAAELLETAILAQNEEANELDFLPSQNELDFLPSQNEGLLGRDYLFALRCLGDVNSSDSIPVRPKLLAQLIHQLANELLYRTGPARFLRYRQALEEKLDHLKGSEGAHLLISHLVTALKDKMPSVRLTAVKSLARLDPESLDVVVTLIEMLRDNDLSVRYQTARSLKQVRRHSDEVIASLIKIVYSNDSTEMREAAIESLVLRSSKPLNKNEGKCNVS